MTSRPVVQVVTGVAVLVWAIGLTIQGVALEWSWLRWYSLAVGAAIIVLLAFDRWVWRLPLARRITRRPNLSGTWKGEFRSTWRDPKTPQTGQPREAYLVIWQTYSSISATLITEESCSESTTAHLDVPKSGTPRMCYTYRNTPKLLLQEGSRIHHGTAFVDVHATPKQSLVGAYWTDRDTKGEMEFRERAAALHTEFGAAQDAFAPSDDAVR